MVTPPGETDPRSACPVDRQGGLYGKSDPDRRERDADRRSSSKATTSAQGIRSLGEPKGESLIEGDRTPRPSAHPLSRRKRRPYGRGWW